MPTPTSMPKSARADRSLVAVTLVLASLAALPVAVVMAHVFVGGRSDTWGHLASTVLPAYIANTLILFCAVGAGTALVGTLSAWLVSTCSFPGSRMYSWL